MRATEVNEANAIGLYGLAPGATSMFRNLQVCERLCNIDLIGKQYTPFLTFTVGMENVLVELGAMSQIAMSMVSASVLMLSLL